MHMKILLSAALALCATFAANTSTPSEDTESQAMELGAFSVSLAVQDLEVSLAFYTKLGFKQTGGVMEQNWLILRNGTTTIGLFKGMFENNIMTFNPGWDHLAKGLDSFEDVRSLQRRLKEQGITPVTEADPSSTGPASCILVDPDGNTIFLDQHVDAP